MSYRLSEGAIEKIASTISRIHEQNGVSTEVSGAVLRDVLNLLENEIHPDELRALPVRLVVSNEKRRPTVESTVEMKEGANHKLTTE